MGIKINVKITFLIRIQLFQQHPHSYRNESGNKSPYLGRLIKLSLLIFESFASHMSLHKKMKFSIKDFFSKCDQIRSFLWIWSHLLNKSLMENFIFCTCMHVCKTLFFNIVFGSYLLARSSG